MKSSDLKTGFYFAVGFMGAVFLVNLVLRFVPAAV
jgi:hypothetical protein